MKKSYLLFLFFTFSTISNAQYLYSIGKKDTAYFLHFKNDTVFLFSWIDKLIQHSYQVSPNPYFLEDTLLKNTSNTFVSEKFKLKKYTETVFLHQTGGKREVEFDKKSLRFEENYRFSKKEAYFECKLAELQNVSPYFQNYIPVDFQKKLKECYDIKIDLPAFKPICEKYVDSLRKELHLIHDPLGEKLHQLFDSLQQFSYQEFEQRFFYFFVNKTRDFRYSVAILDSVAKNNPEYFFELFRSNDSLKRKIYQHYEKPSSKEIRKGLHKVEGYKKEQRYYFWRRRESVIGNSAAITGALALEVTIIGGLIYLITLL